MQEAMLEEKEKCFVCFPNAALFLQEATDAISEGICASSFVIPSIINTTQPFSKAPGLS